MCIIFAHKHSRLHGKIDFRITTPHLMLIRDHLVWPYRFEELSTLGDGRAPLVGEPRVHNRGAGLPSNILSDVIKTNLDEDSH